MKRKSTAKVTALLIVFSLVFPFITWAFDGENYPLGHFSSSHVVYQGKSIVFPQNLGSVKQEFQGTGKTIICIQDLHCNHEIQLNLAGIINYLSENYGLKLVGEEGAFGTVNLDVIKDFPLRPLAGEVSDYYVRQGKLSGAEYEAANSRRPLLVEGIETPTLYTASHQMVLQFLNSESQGYVSDLRDILQEIKNSVYNQQLLDYDAPCQAFAEGKLDLAQYANQLKRQAETAGVDPALFPACTRFLNSPGTLFPTGANPDELYRELELLDHEIRAHLYTDNAQRELDALWVRLNKVEQLLNISATPADVQAFRTHRPDYAFSAFVAFIRKHDPDQNLQPDPELSALDAYLDKASEFYRLADLRSVQFVENLAAKMDAHGESLAVMINGGFHTEGIAAELKKRNFSFVTISPALTKPDVFNPYFSLLQGKKLPLEKWLEKNQSILAVRSWAESETFEPVVEMAMNPLAWAEMPAQKPETRAALRLFLEKHNHVALESMAAADRAKFNIPKNCFGYFAKLAGHLKQLLVLVFSKERLDDSRPLETNAVDFKQLNQWGIAVFANEATFHQGSTGLRHRETPNALQTLADIRRTLGKGVSAFRGFLTSSLGGKSAGNTNRGIMDSGKKINAGRRGQTQTEPNGPIAGFLHGLLGKEMLGRIFANVLKIVNPEAALQTVSLYEGTQLLDFLSRLFAHLGVRPVSLPEADTRRAAPFLPMLRNFLISYYPQSQQEDAVVTVLQQIAATPDMVKILSPVDFSKLAKKERASEDLSALGSFNFRGVIYLTQDVFDRLDNPKLLAVLLHEGLEIQGRSHEDAIDLVKDATTFDQEDLIEAAGLIHPEVEAFLANIPRQARPPAVRIALPAGTPTITLENLNPRALLADGRENNIYQADYQGQPGVLVLQRIHDPEDPENLALRLKTSEELAGQEKKIADIVAFHQPLQGLTFEGHSLAPRILAAVVDEENHLVGYLRDYLPGRTLYALMQDGAVDKAQLEEIIGQVNAQLQILHSRGLFHGDVHPENILVAFTPEGKPVVRLIDFGQTFHNWTPQRDQERFDDIYMTDFHPYLIAYPKVIEKITAAKKNPALAAMLFNQHRNLATLISAYHRLQFLMKLQGRNQSTAESFLPELMKPFRMLDETTLWTPNLLLSILYRSESDDDVYMLEEVERTLSAPEVMPEVREAKDAFLRQYKKSLDNIKSAHEKAVQFTTAPVGAIMPGVRTLWVRGMWRLLSGGVRLLHFFAPRFFSGLAPPGLAPLGKLYDAGIAWLAENWLIHGLSLGAASLDRILAQGIASDQIAWFLFPLLHLVPGRRGTTWRELFGKNFWISAGVAFLSLALGLSPLSWGGLLLHAGVNLTPRLLNSPWGQRTLQPKLLGYGKIATDFLAPFWEWPLTLGVSLLTLAGVPGLENRLAALHGPEKQKNILHFLQSLTQRTAWGLLTSFLAGLTAFFLLLAWGKDLPGAATAGASAAATVLGLTHLLPHLRHNLLWPQFSANLLGPAAPLNPEDQNLIMGNLIRAFFSLPGPMSRVLAGFQAQPVAFLTPYFLARLQPGQSLRSTIEGYVSETYPKLEKTYGGTYFFRNGREWELENHLQNLFAEKWRNHDLHFYSSHLGGSRGLEAYSLAMLVYASLENLYQTQGILKKTGKDFETWVAETWDIQIDSWDIDLGNSVVASLGVFPKNLMDASVIEVHQDLVARLVQFQPDEFGGYYQAQPLLRKWVRAQVMDLVSQTERRFLNQKKYDLIFCCNALFQIPDFSEQRALVDFLIRLENSHRLLYKEPITPMLAVDYSEQGIPVPSAATDLARQRWLLILEELMQENDTVLNLHAQPVASALNGLALNPGPEARETLQRLLRRGLTSELRNHVQWVYNKIAPTESLGGILPWSRALFVWSTGRVAVAGIEFLKKFSARFSGLAPPSLEFLGRIYDEKIAWVAENALITWLARSALGWGLAIGTSHVLAWLIFPLLHLIPGREGGKWKFAPSANLRLSLLLAFLGLLFGFSPLSFWGLALHAGFNLVAPWLAEKWSELSFLWPLLQSDGQFFSRGFLKNLFAEGKRLWRHSPSEELGATLLPTAESARVHYLLSLPESKRLEGLSGIKIQASPLLRQSRHDARVAWLARRLSGRCRLDPEPAEFLARLEHINALPYPQYFGQTKYGLSIYKLGLDPGKLLENRLRAAGLELSDDEKSDMAYLSGLRLTPATSQAKLVHAADLMMLLTADLLFQVSHGRPAEMIPGPLLPAFQKFDLKNPHRLLESFDRLSTGIAANLLSAANTPDEILSRAQMFYMLYVKTFGTPNQDQTSAVESVLTPFFDACRREFDEVNPSGNQRAYWEFALEKLLLWTETDLTLLIGSYTPANKVLRTVKLNEEEFSALRDLSSNYAVGISDSELNHGHELSANIFGCAAVISQAGGLGHLLYSEYATPHLELETKLANIWNLLPQADVLVISSNGPGSRRGIGYIEQYLRHLVKAPQHIYLVRNTDWIPAGNGDEVGTRVILMPDGKVFLFFVDMTGHQYYGGAEYLGLGKWKFHKPEQINLITQAAAYAQKTGGNSKFQAPVSPVPQNVSQALSSAAPATWKQSASALWTGAAWLLDRFSSWFASGLEELNLQQEISALDRASFVRLSQRMAVLGPEGIFPEFEFAYAWEHRFSEWHDHPQANRVWVIRDWQGKIQAFIWASLENFAGQGEIEIKEIATTANASRQGLAARLLQTATRDLAPLQGLRHILLFPLNQEAATGLVTAKMPPAWQYKLDPWGYLVWQPPVENLPASSNRGSQPKLIAKYVETISGFEYSQEGLNQLRSLFVPGRPLLLSVTGRAGAGERQGKSSLVMAIKQGALKLNVSPADIQFVYGRTIYDAWKMLNDGVANGETEDTLAERLYGLYLGLTPADISAVLHFPATASNAPLASDENFAQYYLQTVVPRLARDKHERMVVFVNDAFHDVLSGAYTTPYLKAELTVVKSSRTSQVRDLEVRLSATTKNAGGQLLSNGPATLAKTQPVVSNNPYAGELTAFTHLTPEKFTRIFSQWLAQNRNRLLNLDEISAIKAFAKLLAPSANWKNPLLPGANPGAVLALPAAFPGPAENTLADLKDYCEHLPLYPQNCFETAPLVANLLQNRQYPARIVWREEKGMHLYVETTVAGETVLVELNAEQFAPAEQTLGVVIIPKALAEKAANRDILPWYSKWPETVMPKAVPAAAGSMPWAKSLFIWGTGKTLAIALGLLKLISSARFSGLAPPGPETLGAIYDLAMAWIVENALLGLLASKIASGMGLFILSTNQIAWILFPLLHLLPGYAPGNNRWKISRTNLAAAGFIAAVALALGFSPLSWGGLLLHAGTNLTLWVWARFFPAAGYRTQPEWQTLITGLQETILPTTMIAPSRAFTQPANFYEYLLTLNHLGHRQALVEIQKLLTENFAAFNRYVAVLDELLPVLQSLKQPGLLSQALDKNDPGDQNFIQVLSHFYINVPQGPGTTRTMDQINRIETVADLETMLRYARTLGAPRSFKPSSAEVLAAIWKIRGPRNNLRLAGWIVKREIVNAWRLVFPENFNQLLGPIPQSQIDKVNGVLQAKIQEPENLIQTLAQVPWLGKQYAGNAQVISGFSIGQHTAMVLRQFERYFASDFAAVGNPASVDRDFFRLILALHDIGKTDTPRRHQHARTADILRATLTRFGYSPAQIKLAEALVNGDPLGTYLTRGNLASATAEIRNRANAAGVSASSFLELLLIYYQCDAGAYTSDAYFITAQNGQTQKIHGFPELDRLFDFSLSVAGARSILGKPDANLVQALRQQLSSTSMRPGEELNLPETLNETGWAGVGKTVPSSSKEAYWTMAAQKRKISVAAFMQSKAYPEQRSAWNQTIASHISAVDNARLHDLLSAGLSAVQLESLLLKSMRITEENSQGRAYSPAYESQIKAVIGGMKPAAFIEDVFEEAVNWLNNAPNTALMKKAGINIVLWGFDENHRRTIMYYNYKQVKQTLDQYGSFVPEGIKRKLNLLPGKITDEQVDGLFALMKTTRFNNTFFGIMMGYGPRNAQLHSTGKFENMIGVDDLLNDFGLNQDQDLMNLGTFFTEVNNIGSAFPESLGLLLDMKKGINTFQNALAVLEKKRSADQLAGQKNQAQAFGAEQAELYLRLRQEVVRPHFGNRPVQAAYFGSGGNVAPLLLSTDFNTAVMVDARALGYGQSWKDLEPEEMARDNYYQQTRRANYLITEDLATYAPWWQFKWDLEALGVPALAVSVTSEGGEGGGLWKITFPWAAPGEASRPRTVWFVEQLLFHKPLHDLLNSENLGKLKTQGVDLLATDVLFDKGSDEVKDIQLQLPSHLRPGSLVLTDQSWVANRLSNEATSRAVPISHRLAELSRHFGRVGDVLLKVSLGLERIGVFEIVNTGQENARPERSLSTAGNPEISISLHDYLKNLNLGPNESLPPLVRELEKLFKPASAWKDHVRLRTGGAFQAGWETNTREGEVVFTLTLPRVFARILSEAPTDSKWNAWWYAALSTLAGWGTAVALRLYVFQTQRQVTFARDLAGYLWVAPAFRQLTARRTMALAYQQWSLKKDGAAGQVLARAAIDLLRHEAGRIELAPQSTLRARRENLALAVRGLSDWFQDSPIFKNPDLGGTFQTLGTLNGKPVFAPAQLSQGSLLTYLAVCQQAPNFTLDQELDNRLLRTRTQQAHMQSSI
jgi:chemotaxis methyl-accepting protein methylase/tRNA A-37 threonylcarbamoyl transferase component Bud32